MRYRVSAMGLGFLGHALGATRGEAIAAASARWPFAPWPLELVALDSDPPPTLDPTKTPAAKAKRKQTMADKAEERRQREAAMPPGARAWHQKQRKAKAAARWRAYYLAKAGATD